MSHYRVAVFANKPWEFEDLLAPYSEADEEYFEFIPLAEDKLEWLRTFYKEHSVKAESFEEFLTSEGYVNSEEDGSVIGFYANPHAKWDWYSLDGGAWQFEVLPEFAADDGDLRKNAYNYIDPEYDESRARKTYKRYKMIVDNGEDPYGTISLEEAQEFIQDYPDEEFYLLACKWIYPYAFITPDGEWHAPGEVGWFGASSDTAESMMSYIKEWVAFIESDANPFVNFVDCHI